MPRYFIEVAYKGTKYSGFQVQKNGITIQSEVEQALVIKFGKPFQLTGASRTDAGVHALQNYFHFDIDTELLNQHDNSETAMQKSLYSLNSILDEDIVIKKIFKVDDRHHCRFDAISREYKYYICRKKDPFYNDRAYFYPYTLDFEKLQKAAAIILRTKDFTSFSKKNTQVNNFFCSVIKSEWVIEHDLLIYHVAANRFLRGMVKGLVGTMLRAGTGKISLDEFSTIVESKNVNNADFSVPSHALFLVEVKYPGF